MDEYPTLGNFVEASRGLRKFEAGLDSLHLSHDSSYVILKGSDKLWEIRYVTYLEPNPDGQTFEEMVKSNNLSDLKGNYTMIYPGLTVYAFRQPDDLCKDKGIYFTASFRQI